MTKKIIGAEDIRWDLSDLFTSLEDTRIQETFEQTAAQAGIFEEKYKGRIAELDSPALLTAFQTIEAIVADSYRLSEYSSLLYAIDITDDQIKAFELRVREQGTQVNNRLLFFDLEMGCLSEAQVQTHLSCKELQPYHYYMRRKQETAKYDLSEKEERLANLKDLTGVNAFKNLYEEYTTAFSFEFELDGKKQAMTGEELRALRQHEKPEVRRTAMKIFLAAYQEHNLVISNVFNNVIKDYNIERQLRGYAHPISVQNVHNDLTDEAVNALHAATTESYTLVQRYYRLKSEMLNMPDMTLADIYAPLPQAAKTYTFHEAKDIVLKAFQGFDQDFYDKAKAMFAEKRVDAPVLPNKRGGAFCSSSVPELKPYVMLNFLGRLRDVSTMAHELGHAIHAMYSMEQTLFNFHSILPLAETASVFSEMILTEYLLQHEQDIFIKKSLLAGKLEEIFATSHRQNMFSRFERQVHGTITERLMSSTEFCDMYRKELGLMFGESVRIPDEFVWEWAAIPHMVAVPFYVYAYNFANLLVMALVQQYQEEGRAFIPKLKKLLSLGSVASPTEITAVVGADINHPKFWKKGFQYIESLLQELETLVQQEKKRENMQGK